MIDLMFQNGAICVVRALQISLLLQVSAHLMAKYRRLESLLPVKSHHARLNTL